MDTVVMSCTVIGRTVGFFKCRLIENSSMIAALMRYILTYLIDLVEITSADFGPQSNCYTKTHSSENSQPPKPSDLDVCQTRQ